MFENIKRELELIKRHIYILMIVKENQPIGIIKLAEITKYPQHKVRYSLRILEKLGIIKPSSHGAIISNEKRLENFLKDILKEIENVEEKLRELKSIICGF